MGCSSSTVGFHRTVVPTEGDTLIWSLERHERIILRKSWRLISHDMNGVGAKLVLELFELDTQIRKVFPFGALDDDTLRNNTHFRGTGLRFMQVIGAVIDNMDHLDSSLGQLLQDIGRKHVLYEGFRDEYFELFTVAVLRTWRMILGEKFKPPVAEAWSELIGFLVAKMKEGYIKQTMKNILD